MQQQVFARESRVDFSLVFARTRALSQNIPPRARLINAGCIARKQARSMSVLTVNTDDSRDLAAAIMHGEKKRAVATKNLRAW